MPTSSSTWPSRPTELELPEEIDLPVDVANVGSRTLAILIDLTLGGAVLFVLYAISFILTHDTTDDWMTRLEGNVLRIVVFLAVFAFQWVYFNLFEWAWNGQTPGKRLLHLRVIKADGSPVSGVDVLLRNIARPIDTLGPMGLIGVLMIFINRKAQRLGDLMAGTIVVHELPIDWSLFDQIEAGQGTAPGVRLNSAQWELLHRYLSRRERFEPACRERLMHAIYDKLRPLARGTDLERSSLPPEEWLAELARRT